MNENHNFVCPAHDITKREIQNIRAELEIIDEKIDLVLNILDKLIPSDEDSWLDDVDDVDDVDDLSDEEDGEDWKNF